MCTSPVKLYNQLCYLWGCNCNLEFFHIHAVQKQSIVDYLKGNGIDDEGSVIEEKYAMECNSAGNPMSSRHTFTLLMIRVRGPELANPDWNLHKPWSKDTQNTKLDFCSKNLNFHK